MCDKPVKSVGLVGENGIRSGVVKNDIIQLGAIGGSASYIANQITRSRSTAVGDIEEREIRWQLGGCSQAGRGKQRRNQAPGMEGLFWFHVIYFL
jgi:hypothetical protein